MKAKRFQGVEMAKECIMHWAISFCGKLYLTRKQTWTECIRRQWLLMYSHYTNLYLLLGLFRSYQWHLTSSVLGLRKQKRLWVHNWSTINDRFLKVISIDLVHTKNSKITIMIQQMFSFNIRNHFASTMSSTFTQLQKGSRFVYKLHRMKEHNTYDNLNGKQQYLLFHLS